MSFTSYQFFVFLPVVLVCYFLIPGRWRRGWLLLVSLLFVLHFDDKYLLILLVSTLLSYAAGLFLERLHRRGAPKEKARRIGMFVSVLALLGILTACKYLGFLIENGNRILRIFGAGGVKAPVSLILPIGISYYILQMISYLADVYRGKISAERNLLDFTLYTSFFPKLMSGPIERADAFLLQIRACRSWKLWNWERISGGLTLMVWGYFQKLVIADRLAIFSDEVFGHYRQYGSVELALGVTVFFFQLYADCNGYMSIAQGAAGILGFTLQDNYNAPYFAHSLREYWSRWHVSLSTWLRDYVYIPLGGNRKGELRKDINLLLTFLISGLWHGASWNFVVWGALHGLYQVAERRLEPIVDAVNRRLHTRTQSFAYRGMRIVKTWLLNIIAFVFFKSATLKDAAGYLRRILCKWDPWVLFDGSLYTMGVSEKCWKAALAGLILFFVMDGIKYRTGERIDGWLGRQCIWFRWGFLLMLILSCIVLGAYGPAYDVRNFAYFGF